MEIIKRGTKTPKDKIKYVKECKNCGCVFTYTGRDYCVLGYALMDEYLYMKCPQCKSYISVPLFKKKYKGVPND